MILSAPCGRITGPTGENSHIDSLLWCFHDKGMCGFTVFSFSNSLNRYYIKFPLGTRNILFSAIFDKYSQNLYIILKYRCVQSGEKNALQ